MFCNPPLSKTLHIIARASSATAESHLSRIYFDPLWIAQACILGVEFLPSQLHHWISLGETTTHLAESLLGAARRVCVSRKLPRRHRPRPSHRPPPTRPPSHLPVAPDLKERGLGEVSALRAICSWVASASCMAISL